MLTKAQAKRVAKKLDRIRVLAAEASDVFGDDVMEGGEVWTSLNNITSACDWGHEALRTTLEG
jgi:hypothetical protein